MSTTTEPSFEWDGPDGNAEADPICVECGCASTDHPTVQVTDEALGVDYETQRCPTPAEREELSR